jgi:chromosome segregation ATPase
MSSIGGGGLSRVVNAAGSSATDAVQTRIQSATAQLEGLTADLQGLVAQLQVLTDQLKDLKAQTAPAQGKDQKNDDYAKQVAAWRAAQDAKIDALMGKITSVQGQIADKTRQIDTKEQEVAALQSQLPAAQADDAQKAERARESARKAMEAAADLKKEVQPSTDGQVSSEKKKRERIFSPGAPQGGGIPSGGVP